MSDQSPKIRWLPLAAAGLLALLYLALLILALADPSRGGRYFQIALTLSLAMPILLWLSLSLLRRAKDKAREEGQRAGRRE